MAYRYEINHNLSKRVLRSHCIRLDPTPTQATYFAKGCGTARFAYNWALERWHAQYVAHLKDPSQPAPNEGALRRELNAIKRTEFPWMMEVTKCAPQEAIRALGVAYKNWLHSLSGKRKGLKVKGSANRKKSAQRLAQLHWHIANIRNNALHQLTPRLTRDYGWVAIEDLNVKGMMANHRLARSLADASFGEFRRQLTYKGPQRGVQVAVVDRWYPSSKTCSACGHRLLALPLSVRRWTCPVCQAEHDRDQNAARNILAESMRNITPGVGGGACGA